MNTKNNYCIIMAGGIGSRFWPMSTAKFPKQFHDILGTGKTMLQQTFERIKQIIPTENIFVITNKEYIDLTQEQLPNLPKNNIVGEPMMRNTSACNIYMSQKIAHLNENANIIVLPADHLILKENTFLEKVNQAFEAAEKNDYLITLGIQPTRPDTGYGYINYGYIKLSILDAKIYKYPDYVISRPYHYKVETFTEKPNLETAKKFLEAGNYLWNSGMFIWSAKSILKAFEQHLPEMYQLFSGDFYNTQSEVDFINEIYPKAEQISIDNGILEKADNVYVIPADLGWSDLGTWTSVYENAQKDELQNTKPSKCLTYNAKENIIRIKDKNKIAVIDGLNDYIVVDTEEALLICPKNNDQLIKKYVSDIANQ